VDGDVTPAAIEALLAREPHAAEATFE